MQHRNDDMQRKIELKWHCFLSLRMNVFSIKIRFFSPLLTRKWAQQAVVNA